MVSYDNFVYKMRLHPVAKPCCNVTINDCSIRKYFWLKPEVIEIAFFQDDDAVGRQRSVIPDATAGQNGISQTGHFTEIVKCVGESSDDLVVFAPAPFVDAMFEQV